MWRILPKVDSSLAKIIYPGLSIAIREASSKIGFGTAAHLG